MRNNRLLYYFFVIVTLLAFHYIYVFADTDEISFADADPDKLLEIADERIFKREGFTQDFSETQGCLNEIVRADVLHQYYVRQGKGIDILMSLFPNTSPVTSTNIRLNENLPGNWYNEFHASFTMQRTESIPENGGRCWISLGNYASYGEKNRTEITICPGSEIVLARPAGGKTEFLRIAKIPETAQDEEETWEVIRLDGMLWFYVNGEFVFKFKDVIPGKVTFRAGSQLLSGGNLVKCAFDDLVIRYR